MLKFLFITSVTVIFSIQSYASNLHVPENISVIAINGEEQGFTLFNRPTKLSIKSGTNVLQIRYRELFEDVENDDHVTIKSKPFTVMFEHQSSEDVKLTVPNFANAYSARKFAKKPKITIVTESGQHIAVKQINQTDLLAQQQIKIIKQTSSIDQVNSQPLETNMRSDNIQSTDDNMALQMLNYWWQQANARQRAAFLSEIER